MDSFATLTRALDEAKQEALALYDRDRKTLSDPTIGLPLKPHEVREYLASRAIIIPAGDFLDIEPGERVPIFLGNGKLVKVSVEAVITGLEKVFYALQPENFLHHRFEEENVRVLRDAGFTTENGFIVPDHTVFGVVLDGEKTRVDAAGDGWVLTDDLTVGGYAVRDIEPHHFSSLANREEFHREFVRHMDKLTTFHITQHVEITIQRHGRPENPSQAFSRTLLVRTKDGNGSIVIADLDNLEFVRQ